MWAQGTDQVKSLYEHLMPFLPPETHGITQREGLDQSTRIYQSLWHPWQETLTNYGICLVTSQD